MARRAEGAVWAVSASRRRVLGAGLALAAGPLLGVERAAAYRGWCRRDPVFKIGGDTAHVRVTLIELSNRQARSLSDDVPIGLKLTVPPNVDARFLGGDNGLGEGYDVQVLNDETLPPADRRNLPVKVEVYVPVTADVGSDVAIGVEFYPTNEGSVQKTQGGKKGGKAGKSPLEAGSTTGSANDWILLETGLPPVG